MTKQGKTENRSSKAVHDDRKQEGNRKSVIKERL